MQKKIINTQIAFFFKNDFSGLFENVSIKLKEKFIDGNANFLPIPNNAPKEFPRFVFNYKNITINFFPNRADLYFVEEIENNILTDFIDILLDDLKLTIGGIGYVKSFFIDGGIEIIKSVINEEKIKDLDIKEINLRLNVKSEINKYNCNNIENAVPGKITTPEGTEQEGIIIFRDLNTLGDGFEKNIFKKEDVLELVRLFNEESDKQILISYEV